MLEVIHFELDDHMYVFGDFQCNRDVVTQELIEPHTYSAKAKDTDPDGSYTRWYPSQNLFIVYDNDDIIRIVETCACWSDDYNMWEFENSVLKTIKTTSNGQNRRTWFNYENNRVSEVIWGDSMCLNQLAHVDDQTPDSVLGWYDS